MKRICSFIILCLLALPVSAQNQTEIFRLSFQGARNSVPEKRGEYFAIPDNSNFAFTGGLIVPEGRFMIGVVGNISTVNFTRDYVARIEDWYDEANYFLEYSKPNTTAHLAYYSAALHCGYRLIHRPIELLPYVRLGGEFGTYNNTDFAIRRKRKNENFTEYVTVTESYKYPVSFVPTVGLQVNRALSKWLLVSLDVNASHHKIGFRIDETKDGIFEPASGAILANESWHYIAYRIELGLSCAILTLW